MSETTDERFIPIKEEVQNFLQHKHRLLIGGELVDAVNGETFNVINPADRSLLAKVARGSKEDIHRAVVAAKKSFDKGLWHRKTGIRKRSKILWKIADLIENHQEEFAQLESLDNGKPLKISRSADVPLSIDLFRYFAGLADKIGGDTIPTDVPYSPKSKFFNYTLREPVGIVGQIVPWNFPLLMASWKLAPALACGNSVILKPAEQTPLSALLLGKLMMEAGVPEGVINIVPGFGDAGAALAAHPEVDKIAFTGSTEVGHEIVKSSAGNLKKVSLELGGKSPNIIFADADLSDAIKGAASAIFFNHGQSCAAGSRLFVEKSVYQEVLDGICQEAKKIHLGPGMHLDTQMGPLVSEEQYQRVTGYIESGLQAGAAIEVGGQPCTGRLQSGYFVEPTIFTNTTPDMNIIREEIFGPVLSIIAFESPEEVVKYSNDTDYGLAAGIWTKDVSKAHRVAEVIKAGTVWINCYNVFDAASPFGGYKKSGYGREMGKHVLELYTQTKSVWIDIT